MREADKSTGEKKEQDRINIDPAAGLIRKVFQGQNSLNRQFTFMFGEFAAPFPDWLPDIMERSMQNWIIGKGGIPLIGHFPIFPLLTDETNGINIPLKMNVSKGCVYAKYQYP